MRPSEPFDLSPTAPRRDGSAEGVAVVTVNWNGWRDTLTCLAALRRTRGVAWHLIIVDNGSTDESPSRLSDLGDDVTTILTATNGGWTGGNNLGVAYALRSGYEHLLLLNNDAFVEPDTLAEFLAAHAHEPRAIIGGVLMTEDGLRLDQAGCRPHPRTGVPQWVPLADLRPSRNGLLHTSSVIGGALFAHREVFEAVGAFDDDFYLYYDETDWCARASAFGHANFVAERAVLRHVGAASTGGSHSPLVTYFLTRNSLLFVERHRTIAEHLALARVILGRLRLDAQAVKARWWPITLLTTTDPLLRARRRGLVDYLMRRFGDCPASVRQLQQAWRSAG